MPQRLSPGMPRSPGVGAPSTLAVGRQEAATILSPVARIGSMTSMGPVWRGLTLPL